MALSSALRLFGPVRLNALRGSLSSGAPAARRNPAVVKKGLPGLNRSTKLKRSDPNNTSAAMSFRLFIYYCALCGVGSDFVGWALGRALAGDNPLLAAAVKAMLLGMAVALALSLVDSLWNLSLRQVVLVFQRVTAAVLVGGVGGFFGGLLSHVLY